MNKTDHIKEIRPSTDKCRRAAKLIPSVFFDEYGASIRTCSTSLNHGNHGSTPRSLRSFSAWRSAVIIEGSLEVKLPTIWTDEKQRWEESEKRRKRKSQKKDDPGARKGRKVANHSVFPIIWSSGGSKSRLAKAAGAEPAGQMRDEILHAVVARSTFASEKFWKS